MYVVAINQNTNEVKFYDSLYAVELDLGIDISAVDNIFEGDHKCKSGNSYKFDMIEPKDLPDDKLLLTTDELEDEEEKKRI